MVLNHQLANIISSRKYFFNSDLLCHYSFHVISSRPIIIFFFLYLKFKISIKSNMFLISFLCILCFGGSSLPLPLPLPLSLPFPLLGSSIPPSASIYFHVTCTFYFLQSTFLCLISLKVSFYVSRLYPCCPLIYRCKNLNLGNTLVRACGSCFSDSGLPHLTLFTPTRFLTSFIFLYG